MAKEFEQVTVESRAALRSWLSANHARPSSIWLVTYKKGNPRHLPYGEIVEEALCFGWVDSLPRKLDEARSMLLLSPRRSGSAWSRPNKERVERLIAAGLMQPAGLKLIEEAKRSGLWTKLDAVEDLEVPADLAAALAANQPAASNFETFPRSVKRGILEWIEQAKKPETRAARVADTATKASKNIRANQWRQPKG